jgi:hypothetical protein
MQVEPRKTARNEIPAAPVASDKRRMRNEFWYLVHNADRRRKRANAMMAATSLVVVALFAFFYVVLTR